MNPVRFIHIVMVLGPVITHEHIAPPKPGLDCVGSVEKTAGDLTVKR
jgi:hypothetical protein